MKILLISTYELGRQPFGLASPAAWLRKAGFELALADLSRDSLDERLVRGAGLIALYLPMHTATRLASGLIPKLRSLNPEAHICCYGLYAPMNAEFLQSIGAGTILGGEFEPALVRLAESLARQGGVDLVGGSSTSLARLEFEVPDRSGLPPLRKYAQLVVPGEGSRIVGSTEASRGCKHLCRHCPIVPVYNGIFRIVRPEVVLEDVRRQVAAGAEHLSFGDPDFFNGIGHALKIIEAVHQEFPSLTYDVTIKIEHLLQYELYLPNLARTGCLFVVSAVESVDDRVLGYLAKGHKREDFLHVAKAFREAGLTLQPTFVAFTPWTTIEGYLDLLGVIAQTGLVENVPPIQLGIRLLIPQGSRILELEQVRRMVGEFEAASLTYPWRNPDPRLDALAGEVQELAGAADREGQSRRKSFEAIWQAAHRAAGRPAPEITKLLDRGVPVPFLSEPWYCCAEPSAAQLISIGEPGPVPKPAPTVESYI